MPTTGPYAWAIFPVNGGSLQRTQMAHSQTRRTPFGKKHCVCYSFVGKKAVFRGMIAAIFGLSPAAGAVRDLDDAPRSARVGAGDD